MKTMALTVRDQKYQWQGHVPLEIGQAVVASLSADPPTIRALRSAVLRFVVPDDLAYTFRDVRPRKADFERSDDGPLCAIDLGQRLLISSWDQRKNPVSVHVLTPEETKTIARYDLHPDWILTSDFGQWQPPALKSTQLTAETIQRQLYGTEFLRFLIQSCQPAQLNAAGWTSVQLKPTSEDFEKKVLLPVIEHVRGLWFRSPSSIGPYSVRGVLLRDCVHVQRDMVDRIEQWVATNGCPRGMPDRGEHAPAVGPGRHEVIIYECLIAFLVHRLLVNPLPGSGPELNRSVRLLGRARDWWWSESTRALNGHSPDEVIRFERQRMPIPDHQSSNIIDHDCPLCRLSAADHQGLQFWEFDDLLLRIAYPRFWCGTDENFDIQPDEDDDEEWERCDESEPRSWQREKMYRDCEEPTSETRIVSWSLPTSMSENSRGETSRSAPPTEPFSQAGPWKHTFVNLPPEPVPHHFRVYFLAGYLGEIIEDLKKREAQRSQIDELNRQFDNLIEAVRHSPELIHPVIDRLLELLHDIPNEDIELNAKIECLEGQLGAMAALAVGSS